MTSPVTRPAPATFRNVVIPDARADPGYLTTLTGLRTSIANYKAQQDLARQQYDTEYNNNKRNMGWNFATNRFDPSRTNSDYGNAVYTNANDFGGRGMFYSGANAQAQGNIDQDFANRATNLDTARYNDIASQRQAMVGFQGQTAADKQAALTDAMSRISSKYNIGMSQVPQGKTTTIRQQVV